ncbi:excinuclease ABC subunit UvrA [Candidatus Poribacteria bacterium]|nr:excinuclease ABC subunit UvrA [Candidatus Poribacteria bacterium]
MTEEAIRVQGAREHNLRNIDIQLPKDKLIVFTGVSGSGKSSMAIDTVYAEGQRRYIESLSAYARQFLGQLGKPDVDEIAGLSPSIAIDQGSTGHNPRSTVATVTEVYDYLRVLYARVGQFHCPECGREVGSQTAADIVQALIDYPERTRLIILAPILRGSRGAHNRELEDLRKAGFARVRIDGEIYELRPGLTLNPNQRHDLDVVIDRIVIKAGVEPRVAQAVHAALMRGDGSLLVHVVPTEGEGSPFVSEDNDLLFSEDYTCAHCRISFVKPEPRHFSFNNPDGMCENCRGLGVEMGILPRLIVLDDTLSIMQGAISLWGPLNTRRTGKEKVIAEALARHLGFDVETPWKDLTPEQQHAILYGTGDDILTITTPSTGGHRGGKQRRQYRARFHGIIPTEEQKYRFEGDDETDEDTFPDYFVKMSCRTCEGTRLNPWVKAVTIGDTSITDVLEMSIQDATQFFNELELPERETFIASELLKEIRGRLGFLMDVGLGYLTLARPAPTLSGGEAQRIRLASQVGAGLRDVTYVLDEPSIGLHPRDHAGLLMTLLNLRNQGNTVIVVEHDEATMLVADWIVDFGPGAGIKGGEITDIGTPTQFMEESNTLTAQYLRGDKVIIQPESRRPTGERWVQVFNARQNNLRSISPKIPLGTLCCVTGVSGSGKSSLIHDILYSALARDLMKAKTVPGDYDDIRGIIEGKDVPVSEVIDKIINIDMAPIGRTPRSNAATYTKVFDSIRALYAGLPEAKLRGYKPGRFSFNVTGGRCEACNGNGAKKVDMGLLSDVWVECEVCEGKRFNSETLAVKYKGKNISEVLEMDIETALTHFADIPKVARGLKLLHDVGLDYIKLGQPAPTLSGGEAQRIKLSRELSKRGTGKTLYILDEPTTGLHFDDVNKLLTILHRLVDDGNTVVVVEHNLEVVNSADYLIDLGPEGGVGGGTIVAVGTPEQITEVPESYTGRALRGEFDICSSSDSNEPEGIIAGSDEIVARNAQGRGDLARTEGGYTERDVKLPIHLTEPQGKLKNIAVRGATENNLKNIDIDIPHRKMTALTGVSGSGKTSLALDTVYAEGQRRYIETLSTYARQFIGQMEKPKVSKIEGLSPAIAISHANAGQNPRSTVATITEIHDGLRTLYARWGKPYCPDCQVEVQPQTAEEITEQVFDILREQRVDVLAPLTNFLLLPEGQEGVSRGKIVDVDAGESAFGLKGNEEYADVFRRLQRAGFVRVQIDGEIHRLDETPKLSRGIHHEIFIVIDRVELVEEEKSRFTEAVELALLQSGGFVLIEKRERGQTTGRHFLSEHAMCRSCGNNFGQLTPRHFSFNNKIGACDFCDGRGRNMHPPYDACNQCHGTRLKPFPSCVRFENVTVSELMALSITEIIEFFDTRLNRIEARSVADDVETDRSDLLIAAGVSTSRATHPSLHIHTSPEFEAEVLRQIRTRLRFLEDIGLGYLALDRGAPTLSGGEMRRIQLASQLGSGLTGVTYILDEPSIGLHPRDQERLIAALKELRDIGNSVLVVEHDRETILAADHVIDFGPQAGKGGGEIVAIGTPDTFTNGDSSVGGVSSESRPVDGPSSAKSLTQAYLSDEVEIPVPKTRREGTGKQLTISGAKTNNLKDIDVKIPLGTLTCVTGVSGCGKSSLVEGTLKPALESRSSIKTGDPNDRRYTHYMSDGHREPIYNDYGLPEYERIRGVSHIKRLINVDQKAIGETPRSNPATYTDLFTKIRELFAEQHDAKQRGYSMGMFSFNLAAGQCHVCEGHRFNRVEMHFLPDVWMPCETCNSTGYSMETLEIRYNGKNIAEVLNMTVDEALAFFSESPRICRTLQMLTDVGLGYIELGQSATTLSGGEAQRVKLAKELARRQTGSTLYIMDEPTTGLHFDDIQKLLKVLNRLVDAGNTIIAVEHNIDVIKSADWIIDLGPEGSKGGGEVVAMGTPEDVASVQASHTARFLREVL